MGYIDNKRKKQRLLHSFLCAFKGIKYVLLFERNMIIHIAVTVCVILAGFYFQVSGLEWCILLITIAMVIGLEMMNTAIEAVVDLITKERHPLAKRAKDVAAGAVLIAAIAAVFIGCIIFIPYLK